VDGFFDGLVDGFVDGFFDGLVDGCVDGFDACFVVGFDVCIPKVCSFWGRAKLLEETVFHFLAGSHTKN
jgi:hypothetical protein